jgi:hypothetical protein
MTAKQLSTPSELWSFYEQKKEAFLTKEEEHFAKKVFQYTIRLLNGKSFNQNRSSLNQKALIRAARIWIKEYEDFKRGCSTSYIPTSRSQEKRTTIIQQEKIGETRTDAFLGVMTDVLGGQVYTTDNQYTMMKIQNKSIFNEKRRGEHKYPRQRD